MKFGMDAIKAADFPHEFAAVAMQKSFDFKVSLALRAGQPPNTNKGFPISPKPMSMKTKTSSDAQGVPLVAGFIPWDQATFGRPNSDPIHPEKGFVQVTLPTTLDEILRDAQKGAYEITQVGDRLEFKAIKAEDEKKRNLTFSINLKEGENPHQDLKKSITEMRPWHAQSNLDPPSFWDENKWGSFDEQVGKLFPVSYKKPDGDFEPLHVAATLADGKIVTGDADKLWDAIPIDFIRNHEGHFSNTYNAATIDGLEKLMEAYFDLSAELTGTEEIDVSEISSIVESNIDTFAVTAGIITPFELLLAKVVNDEFAKTAPFFNTLFQHGPETNNPGNPSPLDGNMLHFHKGLAVLTETEDELVEFVMQPGYLDEHYIPIHKGWDMQKWSAVIARQIELGHPIKEETMKAYQQYQETKRLAEDRYAEQTAESLAAKTTSGIAQTITGFFNSLLKSANAVEQNTNNVRTAPTQTAKISTESTGNLFRAMGNHKSLSELQLGSISYGRQPKETSSHKQSQATNEKQSEMKVDEKKTKTNQAKHEHTEKQIQSTRLRKM